MRVLLSTIGSRGDVQPLVALGLALKELGQDVRLCVSPDFREWIEGLGMEIVPIGPELRSTAKAGPASAGATPTPAQVRQMMEGTVAAQFETISAAAVGCEVIVGATALQVAAPSVAERMGVPYVFAAYCPNVLPSRHHAPPVLGMLGDTPADAAASDHGQSWEKDAQRWNAMWRESINVRRVALGLAEIEDVRSHVLTKRPWLAADATLAPWPDAADESVWQTGAWTLRDSRPLGAELERFLDAGEPPIYFGFGSMRAPQELSAVMIEAARAVGRRAIVSRGWAELEVVGDAKDCLAIGEVNQQALFRRVAAVVHHGGAGTTTAAARAGAAQVVVPQMYDQYYWAGRVEALGIGKAHSAARPTAESLTSALEGALHAAVAERTRAVASKLRDDGAPVAAQRLVASRG